MSKLTTHQRKARDLMQREDWNGALAELQRVLGLDANNPMLHNQIGDVHLRKGDIEQACDHFELAVDLYTNLGLHNNAVALCRKVVRLAPTRVEVRYNLARLRMDQGLRSDAASAFVDYLEHAHPESDDAADALEQRCVEVVESYPDIAPVGQILEKLETLERPEGAYKIVQRAAQRAADSGDVVAAKRLTEKMRSLRVLLKSMGRDTDASVEEPAAQGEVDAPDQQPVEAPQAHPVEEAQPPKEQQATSVRNYTDPGAIDLPGLDANEPDSVPSPQAEAIPQVDLPEPQRAQPPASPRGETASPVEAPDDATQEAIPEIDLDAADSLEESMAALQDEVPSGAVSGSNDRGEVPPQAKPTSQPQVDSQAASDEEDVVVGDVDAGLMPEYELPETSLEDVANLLQEEGVEPTPVVDEAPQGSAILDEEDEVAGPAAGGDVGGSRAATIAETFADPPSVSPAARHQHQVDEANTDPDDDRPASVVYEPAPGSRLPTGSSDDVRRQPVWIPSPDAMSEDPSPSEEGQIQELEEVIDTFREQMARALGDDGSARYDLGVAYYDMGLYNEALAEFEVAVKCPGLTNRTLEMMASCLAEQGRHDEVVSLLAAPLAENDAPSQERLALQYAMGLALEAVGKQDDARRHFEEVALVDIGFKDVQSRLQR